MIVAHPFDYLVFQHPQQFDLGEHGQVTDFIEKDAAAVGRLKAAGPVPGGRR